MQTKYVAGTSRKPRSSRTLALRMALEFQHQQEVADRIREKRGLVPQPVIAERVGVTLRACQEWEAGGGIKWENYGKLALALGTTVEYLMHGSDEQRALQAAEEDATQLDRIEKALAEQRRLLTRLLESLTETPLSPEELRAHLARVLDDLDRVEARAQRGTKRAPVDKGPPNPGGATADG